MSSTQHPIPNERVPFGDEDFQVVFPLCGNNWRMKLVPDLRKRDTGRPGDDLLLGSFNRKRRLVWIDSTQPEHDALTTVIHELLHVFDSGKGEAEVEPGTRRALGRGEVA